MNRSLKIACVLFGALVVVLVLLGLTGCGDGGGSRPAAVPPGPEPVVIQPAGKNRSLGELQGIARGDVPEPGDLSAADRSTVAQMRRK